MTTFELLIWRPATAGLPEPPTLRAKTVAGWLFENAANLGADYIGNNNGAVTGAGVTAVADGRIGGSVQFNDSSNNSHISIPDSPNIQGGDRDFTISLWVKLAATGNQAILAKDLGAGREYNLYMTNALNFLVAGGSNTAAATTGLPTPIGEWMHVLCEYDAASSIVALEVNGERGQRAISFAPQTTIQPLLIGTDGRSNGLPLSDGSELDNIYFFNSLLTVEEKAYLLSGGSIGLSQLDFTNLSNLPDFRKPLAETAAIAAAEGQSYSAQEVLDAVANFAWLNGEDGIGNYSDAAKATLSTVGGEVQTMQSMTGSQEALQTIAASRPTQQDGYLQFDGTDDYLELNSFMPSDPTRIAAIFAIQSSDNSGWLFAHRSEGTRLIQLSNANGLQMRDSTNTIRQVGLGPNPFDGSLHIVSMFFDKTSKQSARVDGAETASNTDIYTGDFNAVSTRIGSYTNNTSPTTTTGDYDGNIYTVFISESASEDDLIKVERFANAYYNLGVIA